MRYSVIVQTSTELFTTLLWTAHPFQHADLSPNLEMKELEEQLYVDEFLTSRIPANALPHLLGQNSSRIPMQRQLPLVRNSITSKRNGMHL